MCLMDEVNEDMLLLSAVSLSLLWFCWLSLFAFVAIVSWRRLVAPVLVVEAFGFDVEVENDADVSRSSSGAMLATLSTM